MPDAPTSPPDDDLAAADSPSALDECADAPSTDTALHKLEGTLDSALGRLAKHNRQVEEYLDFLKQERQRDLQGTAADQMTFADLAESQMPQEPTGDAPAGATPPP